MKKCTSIGGQALIEGIMMKGPYKTVMAVRAPDGSITTEEQSDKRLINKSKVFKVPLIRGAVNFIDALISGYKALMRSADLSGLTALEEEEENKKAAEKKAAKAKRKAAHEGKSEQDQNEIYEAVLNDAFAEKTDEEKQKSKKATDRLISALMIVATVLGVAIAVFLFMYLPAKLFNLINGAAGNSISYLRALFEGILKIIIFLLYIVLVSKTPDIKRVFMYHGAEHKSIACYESGLELTVENVQKQTRFHPRCGTSFMIVMLIVGILFTFLLQTVFPVVTTILPLWVAVKILILPIICGLGYEFIRYCGRHDNALTKILAAPGLWTQRITTKPPSDDMCEVAITALCAVIPDDGSDTIKK